MRGVAPLVMLLLVLGLTPAGRPVSAQSPARDATASTAPPSGTATIAGTVTDDTGKPVRRATVTILGDMRLERLAVTDNDGHFALSDLPAGRFTVKAAKAGYPEVSYGAKRPHRDGAGIFLKAGQQALAIDLVLGRGAAMTGTVYDEQGQPMSGVPVQAWEVRTALSGERTLEFGDPEVVTTDDRGVYRVFGLAPGDYTVGTSWYYSGDREEVKLPTPADYRAAFPGPNQPPVPPVAGNANNGEDPARYNYSPVFSPGVVDPLSADTFSLKPGEVRAGVDLRMQFLPTARLQGTIVNPDGKPVTIELLVAKRGPVSALNSMRQYPGLPGMDVSLDSMSPGPYTLLAQTRDRSDGPPLWARADVLLSPGETSSIVLSLQPAVTVTGQLVFDGTLPPPPDPSRVQVSLSQIPSTLSRNTRTIDPDGAVSIGAVIPGRYTVRASVPGGVPSSGAAWTLSRVTVGGVDVTDREFDISEAGVSDLTVTFTDRLSELSGLLTTQSGVPQPDYFVIALPADRALWMERSRRIVSTRPDANGRYVFSGLPAGDYRIAVTTDLIPNDLRDMSALAQLAAQSLETTIAEGEHKTLDIRTGGGS